MTTYRQVFASDGYAWPSGNSQDAALFSTTPEELSARVGLTFEAGVDDLDHYRAAGVELRSGRRVLLTWYENSPVKGLLLQVDRADDSAATRTETMATLALAPDELLWQPESDAPAG